MLWLRQLLLILWKCLILKKRHFIVTIFELLLPLAAISFMLYLKSLESNPSSGSRQEARIYSPYRTDAYRYRRECYFTPNTSRTDEITMLARNFSKTSVPCIGVLNEENLFDMVVNSKDYDAYGIIYENVNKELPETLRYKIRMKYRFNTDSTLPSISVGGPSYVEYDYIYSGFLNIQYGIDTAFLLLNLPEDKRELFLTKPELWMQRMPYPSYYGSALSIIWALPMMTVISFMVTITVFVKRLVDEKANRAKELMRMMGMNDFTYFFGNWCIMFLTLSIVLSIAVIMYKIPISNGQSVITKSDGFLVFIILMLYAANAALFCIAISTFFNRPIMAAIVSFTIWLLSYFLPTFLLDPPSNDTIYMKLSLGAKLATCLLPNAALHFAFGKHISFNELYMNGTNWSNMNDPIAHDNLSMSAILGMMVASATIYCFIIWYMDNVCPWQFGIPKHPLFFLKRTYWFPRVSNKTYSQVEEDIYQVDRKYFEDEPRNKPTGISILNLTKAFGWGRDRKLAVKDVSLNMFHGEITALLGHNGAGKTTTMNVITGLFPPTSGTASVNGFDIRDNLKQARHSLGLCPQHNVLFQNLTVEEHLKLFAGLKGMPFSKMQQEITWCLELLQLQNKRHELAQTLSGGMKRKLSLGIAFIGGSKVLILDEPTSGMDPQARRAIWDLLQHIRAERTIVLTTHYMEEADYLGDRIAIMADGVVQCCGSPLFLKSKFGAGYHLRVSKAGNYQEQLLSEVVKRSVPTAFVDTDMRTEVSYILPVNEPSPFIQMFEELENQKNEIGYSACGLTITTMEDVFIKVGQLAEKVQDSNGNNEVNHEVGTDTSFYIRPESLLRGFPLWRQQVKGLFGKRFHDSRRYIMFIIFLIVLPMIFVFIMLLTRNYVFNLGKDSIQPLTLDLQSIFQSTTPLYGRNISGNGTEAQIGNDVFNNLLPLYSQNGGTAVLSTNLTETVLQRTENNIMELKSKLIVGGFVSESVDEGFRATAWYSGEVYHATAISLNLMDVAILRAATGNPKLNIITTNAPLPIRDRRVDFQVLQFVLSRLIIACFFPLALAFLSSSFVLFPIHERQTKSKLMQLMSGIDGLTFWLCHFVWDFAMHFVASCFMLIPFAAMDYTGNYAPDTGALGAFLGLMIMFGWSSIPLSYLLSFISKKPSTGFVIAVAISFISGLGATLAISVYKMYMVVNEKEISGVDTAAWFLRLLPSFAVTWGTANVDELSTKTIYCNQKSEEPAPHYALPPSMDCTPRSLASMSAEGCGRELLFMFLSGLIFLGILVLLEGNMIRFWYRFKDRNAKNVATPADTFMLQMSAQMEDSDVAAERVKVEQLYLQNQVSGQALVAFDLTKYFGNINAVDHVHFSVNQNECFGLLGVNGAGKTTTFSMLTGDLAIDNGNAFIGNCSVKDDLKQFQRQVGYCPQFDALLDRLTGREALYMFARLRGVPEAMIPGIVKSYITMTDLQKHADKSASKYSGGNRRKLSLALALIGSPPVVFLDEPTAGVDPASRRKIWTAFTQVQKMGGTSFILTTHSMEESEALCGRLVIMVNGKFRCLGAIQYLKSKFGQGYTVIVKLNKDQHLDPAATQNFRYFFEHTFPGSLLKDIHQGMLHYHVVDTRYSWSQLFREMEKAKHMFQLEDYFISDTTLEQIFLAFAKSQRMVASN